MSNASEFGTTRAAQRKEVAKRTYKFASEINELIAKRLGVSVNGLKKVSDADFLAAAMWVAEEYSMIH